MSKGKGKDSLIGNGVVKAPVLEPWLKQSVRTTFRLTESCINSLADLAEKFGISQKELFEAYSDFILKYKELLTSIHPSSENASKPLNDSPRQRKAYVISRQSLEIFNQLASEYNIPRDLLVESGLNVFKEILNTAENQKRKLYEEAAKLIGELSDFSERISNKLEEILSDGDPILTRITYVKLVADNLLGAIESNLLNGVPIDSEDITQNY